MIELKGVCKAYGSKRAVDHLDLNVRKPANSSPSSGPTVRGRPPPSRWSAGSSAPTPGPSASAGFAAASPEARQLIAYVPDQPYLYEKLTGREFLRFVVEMYGLDPRAATRRIAELVETFEMGDYVDELSENYSHGMKQRVVFASALVHDPKVLIVDEPLVGLDPRSARIVKDLFISQARSGVAVLMSTHLLSIAEELADTIGIVDHGRMLAHGTLAELRDKVQMHGPLEDLFLKLTGGDRPLVDGPSAGPGPGRRPMTGPSSDHTHPGSARPTQVGSAFRFLRWRLGCQRAPGLLLSGSRLRLSMIVICSAIFWSGLVLPVLRRLPVHQELHPQPGRRVRRIHLQYVLPVAPGDADLLGRYHPLHRAIPVARGGVPADHPGLARPDLRLQILRGDRLFELGVPAPGKPPDGLVRDRRGRLVGVLRGLPAVLPGLRADPREPGGGRCLAGGGVPASSAEDRAGDRRGHCWLSWA